MRVFVLAGFSAFLASSALAADYREGPSPLLPDDVILEEVVRYPEMRRPKITCIKCRGASLPWGGLRKTYKAHLPWGGLRKPAVAGLPWGGLRDYCPPVRSVRAVIVTKG